MPNTRKPAKPLSEGYAANMEGVAAVDRAMGVIAAVCTATSPPTLSELAGLTGQHKSTLLRLMVSLERSTVVIRRQDQRYVLGPLAFRLGRAYEVSHHLTEFLLPVMQALVDRGMESPSFHVLQDDQTRLCLMRLDSRHSTLDRVRAGDVLPLKKGAAGKVLRKYQPGNDTVAAPPVIETSYGERDPLCGAVAAPVFGPGSIVLGALSLSGPLERFNEVTTRKMSKPLLDAAEAATHALGGSWPGAARVPNRRRPATR